MTEIVYLTCPHCNHTNIYNNVFNNSIINKHTCTNCKKEFECIDYNGKHLTVPVLELESERKLKAGEYLTQLLRLTRLDIAKVDINLKENNNLINSDYAEVFSSNSNYSVKQSIECDSVYAMIKDIVSTLKCFT